MSAVFLIWYFAYVLLGAFAHDFMAIKVWGTINVGLLIGLGNSSRRSSSPVSTSGSPTVNSTREPKRFVPSSKAVRHDTVGCRHHRRQSRRQHRHLRGLRRDHAVHRDPRQQKNTTAAEFFTAGRSFTGPQNGIAISGDYLSAASFLGIAGAIAVYGYDGFLYSIGFLVAWLVALLLVAELLRTQQIHDGRRAELPAQATPGPDRRGHHHAGGVPVLSARADGGCGWPGGTAAHVKGQWVRPW